MNELTGQGWRRKAGGELKIADCKLEIGRREGGGRRGKPRERRGYHSPAASSRATSPGCGIGTANRPEKQGYHQPALTGDRRKLRFLRSGRSALNAIINRAAAGTFMGVGAAKTVRIFSDILMLTHRVAYGNFELMRAAPLFAARPKCDRAEVERRIESREAQSARSEGDTAFANWQIKGRSRPH